MKKSAAPGFPSSSLHAGGLDDDTGTTLKVNLK
jgi:hypothetical protein